MADLPAENTINEPVRVTLMRDAKSSPETLAKGARHASLLLLERPQNLSLRSNTKNKTLALRTCPKCFFDIEMDGEKVSL